MENASLFDPAALAAIAVALTLGGLLKGATGAGSPVIAVPVIAAVYDVRLAVALMVIPNLITNLSQIVKFRRHALEPGFARNLALAGVAGAAIGTLLLAWLPVSALQLLMAGTIVVYIALRLARPDLQLPLGIARTLVWPAGFFGGVLQGASGVSAPVAVTFLNAMRLPRATFILTVSTFFAAMCLAQLPLQIGFGLMTRDIAILGVLALIPMFIAMPVGDFIGRRISAALFDRVILIVLAILAVRLVWVELG